MSTADYSTTLLVEQTSEEVFNAINNVPAWWSAAFEGHSQKLNDEYTVSFGETWITLKVVELVPDKKVLWLVTDCYKHWLKDKKEWNGTQLSWEITATEKGTQISFKHIGLVPSMECYGGCENAWNYYVNDSLFKLISEGEGQPESK